MYELLIYTKFVVLHEVGRSITHLIGVGEGYSQATHFVVLVDGAEVYRHVNLEA